MNKVRCCPQPPPSVNPFRNNIGKNNRDDSDDSDYDDESCVDMWADIAHSERTVPQNTKDCRQPSKSSHEYNSKTAPSPSKSNDSNSINDDDLCRNSAHRPQVSGPHSIKTLLPIKSQSIGPGANKMNASIRVQSIGAAGVKTNAPRRSQSIGPGAIKVKAPRKSQSIGPDAAKSNVPNHRHQSSNRPQQQFLQQIHHHLRHQERSTGQQDKHMPRVRSCSPKPDASRNLGPRDKTSNREGRPLMKRQGPSMPDLFEEMKGSSRHRSNPHQRSKASYASNHSRQSTRSADARLTSNVSTHSRQLPREITSSGSNDPYELPRRMATHHEQASALAGSRERRPSPNRHSTTPRTQRRRSTHMDERLPSKTDLASALMRKQKRASISNHSPEPRASKLSPCSLSEGLKDSMRSRSSHGRPNEQEHKKGFAVFRRNK